MGVRRRGGFERESRVRVNKRFAYRWVTYITIQDASRRSPKLVYRTRELIVKRFRARYYGVRVRKDGRSHIHAILVSEKFIDPRFVNDEVRPSGIHVYVVPLVGKTTDDLKRIVNYIESDRNSGRRIGSRYVVRLARSLLPCPSNRSSPRSSNGRCSRRGSRWGVPSRRGSSSRSNTRSSNEWSGRGSGRKGGRIFSCGRIRAGVQFGDELRDLESRDLRNDRGRDSDRDRGSRAVPSTATTREPIREPTTATASGDGEGGRASGRGGGRKKARSGGRDRLSELESMGSALLSRISESAILSRSFPRRPPRRPL